MPPHRHLRPQTISHTLESVITLDFVYTHHGISISILLSTSPIIHPSIHSSIHSHEKQTLALISHSVSKEWRKQDTHRHETKELREVKNNEMND